MNNSKLLFSIFSLLFLNLFSLNAMQRTEQQILEQNTQDTQVVMQNEDLLEIITQGDLKKLKSCRQINKEIFRAANNLICSKIISDEINFLKSLNDKYFNAEEYSNVSADLKNFIENNHPRYDMQDKQILKNLIKDKQDFLQKYIKYIKFKYQKNFVIKIKNFFWHKDFYNKLNSLLKDLFYHQHIYLTYFKNSLIKIKNFLNSCTMLVRRNKKFCKILFIAIVPALTFKLCSLQQTNDPNFWLKVALND